MWQKRSKAVLGWVPAVAGVWLLFEIVRGILRLGALGVLIYSAHASLHGKDDPGGDL